MAKKEKKEQQLTIYEQLQQECDALGITVHNLCVQSEVDPSAVSRWNGKEPKTILTLRALQATIDKLKKSKVHDRII